jgi:hypothetical protein
MAVKHVDLADLYTPKTSNKNIILDVQIGDGQSGAYTVFLGMKLISANEPANLGKKANVSGKKTTVSVTVIDTLQETNWTSMTVIVSEGEIITSYGPYKVEAEDHLDTIIYTLKLVNQ